jgi:predicted nucleic acid-binding Zn ribbon protein
MGGYMRKAQLIFFIVGILVVISMILSTLPQGR